MVGARTSNRWMFAIAGLIAFVGTDVAFAQNFPIIRRPRPSADCPACDTMPSMPAMQVPSSPDSTSPGASANRSPNTTSPSATPPSGSSPSGTSPSELPPTTTPDAKAPATDPNVAPPQPKADTPEPKIEPMVSSALGDNSFASSTPQMIGDFGGYRIRRLVLVPTTLTTTTTTVVNNFGVPTTTNVKTQTSTVFVPINVDAPVAGRSGSGFKVGDNASPIPTDRVFFTYNCFDGLGGGGGSFAGAANSVSTIDIRDEVVTIKTTVDRVVAGANVRQNLDLHREIFGFEKTFLGGDASFEIRVPIFQTTGDVGPGFSGDHFGDLTTIVKFALINDPDRVFSVGLATTFPTGPAIQTGTGDINAVLFQPFVGYVVNYGDIFVQGFSSIVLSTDAQDPTLMFNDIAVGYRLYKGENNQILTSISPVFEIHLTTPFDRRDSVQGLSIPDILSLTGGVHVGIGARSNLTFGYNLPISGPTPYNGEFMMQFNYRF